MPRLATNRWFWVSLALLAMHAASAALWWKASGSRRPTKVLRVARSEPGSLQSPVLVTFSRPMRAAPEGGPAHIDSATFADLAAGAAAEIRLDPFVELAGAWRSTTTLELVPQEPLRKATPYRLSIPQGILDADGYPLAGKVVFELPTRPLEVTEIRQAALSSEWAATIEVAFDDEVSPADLDRAIRFRDETGAEVAMERITRSGSADRVRFRSLPERRRSIEVTVAAGLAGVAGPLGLAESVTTRVELEPGLRLREAQPGIRDVGDGYILLRFSQDVDPRVARGFIRIEPAVAFEVGGYGGGLRVGGSFQPGGRYRLALEPGLPAKGGGFLADRADRSIRMPDLSPSIGFLGEGRFLAANGSRTALLRSVNVDDLLVAAERIFPNNLVSHLHGHRHSAAVPPKTRRIRLGAPRNEVSISPIDLEELAGGWRGPIVLAASAAGSYRPRAARTLTLTDLAVHAKLSRKGLLAWVVRLSSLSPVEGASVRLLSRSDQELYRGTTDRDGLARFEGTTAPELGEPFVITAEAGGDFSFLPLEDAAATVRAAELSGRPYPKTAVEAFVYPERGVIRPGEALHLRALLRRTDGSMAPEAMPVEWQLARPGGRLAASVPGTLSRYGTTEMEWKSEPHHPTGRYTVRVRVPGGGAVLGRTAFRVEEFLPQTLRVRAEAEERRFAGGSPLSVRVRAEHLFGGPAAGLRASARCTLVSHPFTLDEWEGVEFMSSTGELAEHTIDAEPAVLDAEGHADFEFALPAGLRAKAALRAAVTVTVLEVSGRAAVARVVREVDPLPFYLGVRQPPGHAAPGEPWTVECIAVLPDGTTLDVPHLEARVTRVSWNHSLEKGAGSSSYRWKSRRVEQELVRSDVSAAAGVARFSFTPDAAGDYVVRFTAPAGESGVPVEASATVVAGGDGSEPGSLDVPARIHLAADREAYRTGETARLRVVSPITGLALLTTETDRVHTARTFELAARETTLDVPVDPDLVPHGHVTLTVVRRSLESGPPGLPVRAYGATALPLDVSDRTAAMEIRLPEEARPGTPIELDISVRRPDGSPESCEVAVALVDTGLLALTAFEPPDPLAFFASRRRSGTRAADLFSLIVPEPDHFLARGAPAPGGGRDARELLSPIVANRVTSVSLWLGRLQSDGEGRIRATVPLPDFDGELSVLAVAAGETTLGSAMARVRVRRPVLLEPALPRFLAPGDRCTVQLTVHNTTAREVHATVTMAASEALHGTSEPRDLTLGAHASATSTFSLEAAGPGRGTVAFSCRALGEEVEKRVELPVRPAMPPVTRSESHILRPGGTLELGPPSGFLDGTVRSEVVLSPRMLPALEGSLRYLLRYPHGCLEQTTSRLIPWITLGDYMKAMDAEAYSESEIRERVEAGIERLFSMQTGDGGLAGWPGGDRTYPYGTLHAASILLEAHAAGFPLPEEPLEKLLQYLERLLASPGDTDPRRAGTLRAYAVRLLARAGKVRRGWIETLYERREELGDEGRAHLAVAAAIARCELSEPLLGGEGMSEDGDLEPPRDLGGLLYSRPRELCLVLSALVDLGATPEELLPLFQQITAARENGRFRSTQEDGLFVLAAGKMARLVPPPAGPVHVRLHLPDGTERTLEAAERIALELPPASGPLRLSADGVAYVFFETRGVPLEEVAAVDSGLEVRRRFLRADGTPHGEGPFRQGERYLVEIALDCPRPLENVAVLDPLAAGMEIENPHLVSADGTADVSDRLGLERSDLRDDRLILFVNPRSGGSSYRYVVRAVTPGDFALPPVSAECMYDTALRSLHGAGRIQVVR